MPPLTCLLLELGRILCEIEVIIFFSIISVANLRCTPKKAPMGSIDQDSAAKRFTVYRVKTDHHSSKKSSIEENDIVYDRDGLPVDTARTVVKAFQS